MTLNASSNSKLLRAALECGRTFSGELAKFDKAVSSRGRGYGLVLHVVSYSRCANHSSSREHYSERVER